MTKTSKAYYMAQVTKDLKVKCQEHGVLAEKHADRDDALDAAAAHDAEHGYDGEAGEE